MRVGSFAFGRRPAFELVEQRRLLAADLPIAVGDIVAEPPVMQLPGSIAGGVFALGGPAASNLASGAAISGARLELLNAAGETLAEAITDESGAYEFPALEPGEYSIRQTQPAGFVDEAARIGSGGGRAVTPNYVTQILVDAGSMLVGYDFIEQAALAPNEHAAVEPALVAPVPPMVVSWPRPVAPVEAPMPWSSPTAATPTPPIELRRPEPIFGGSSGVIAKAAGDNEPFADAEFVEHVARAVQATREDQAHPHATWKRRDSSARDMAFERGAEGEDDGADGGAALEHPPAAAPAAMHHRAEARGRTNMRQPAA